VGQKYIIIIVLLILLVLFLAFNSEQTNVSFILFDVRASTALIIIFSALIGLIIGMLLPFIHKKKPAQKQKQNQI